MWSRARESLMLLLVLATVSGRVNAFVPPAPQQYGSQHRSAAVSDFRRGLSTSAAAGTSRTSLSAPSHLRGEEERAWRSWGKNALFLGAGARSMADNGDEDAEERKKTAFGPKARAAAESTSKASNLVTGAAVVALATLGGFPDLAAAEAPAWVGPTKLILDPILLYFEVAFVARIVLSWYPQLDLNAVPQNLVAWPTEPILRPTRAVVPPAFGVDISPIVWVMICSLLHEILLGQQGILNLMSNK